ncbi:transposase-like protein [Streptomyces zagrosensis]|uniref:Mutator family transposase n=2 Tax=Streptomyces zagrosensis TaxID=1042984 RepID=A0A7W9V3G4_9ACTN|nr:transposase-like protein [Streptomyces zagrosensis]
MLFCDGLTGLPDAENAVWPAAIVQTCVVHLLRNGFRYAARQDWEKIAKTLRPACTPPTEKPPWSGSWSSPTPGPEVSGDRPALGGGPGGVRALPSSAVEVRKIVCTTNAIERINARIRKAVRARGHFPTSQAALKCFCLAVMSLDPTSTGRKRWTMRWKTALQAFDIAFDGRLTTGRH